MTNKFVTLFSQKVAERSEANSAKRSFASKLKIQYFQYRSYFDAKLRFALLASLYSAIFSENKVDKLLVIFGVKSKDQKITNFQQFLDWHNHKFNNSITCKYFHFI